jgi:ribose transport system ATP-binding protein
MGSGQIELARALFGKLPLRRGGLKLDGKPVKFRSTAAARKAGYPARRIACFQEAAAAGQFLRRELHRDRDAVVLFKGSRGMALEKAIAEFRHE